MLLDTNILFLPVRNGFPLEAELARLAPGAVPTVPTAVLDELERLVLRATPDAAAALAFARRFPRVSVAGRGDDALVRAAAGQRFRVATGDRELRDRLLGMGVEVFAPRDRHRLELHRPRTVLRSRRPARPANSYEPRRARQPRGTAR